jgi:hypothetical protein
MPAMRRVLVPAISSFALLTLSACGGGGGAATDETTAATAASTSSGVTPTSSSAGAAGTSSGEASSSSSEAASSSDASSSASGATSDSSSGDSSDGGSSDSGLSGTELRVLQLNLCHSGVAGCFTGDAVMTRAVAVIAAVQPGLVTLNEVCRADLPWLAGQTGAVDHRFTPALKADDTPVKCTNGDDYGNGLLAWFPAEWDAPVTGVYAAQSSMTERRVWICMGYTGFVGCTTHLSTAGETALAQCMDVVGGPLATAAAGGPAVLAGDWNLKYKGDPDAQDCVPGGFYRKGDGSVQHVIASDDLAFLETIVIDMDGTTDHPGLEVRLTLP